MFKLLISTTLISLFMVNPAFAVERISTKYDKLNQSFEELLNNSWQVTGVYPSFILKKGSNVVFAILKYTVIKKPSHLAMQLTK